MFEKEVWRAPGTVGPTVTENLLAFHLPRFRGPNIFKCSPITEDCQLRSGQLEPGAQEKKIEGIDGTGALTRGTIGPLYRLPY